MAQGLLDGKTGEMVEKLDILIPTMKPLAEIRQQIDEIEANTHRLHRIIAGCQDHKESVSRWPAAATAR